MNDFDFDDQEKTRSVPSSRSGGQSRWHSHRDDDHGRPLKKSSSPTKPILLIGGIVAGMVLLVVMAAVLFGSKSTKPGANTDKPALNPDRKLTIPSVDEEFRVAASQKGERALVAAKMLIEFRNNDKWPWERLKNEVDFQFNEIKAEFDNWKKDRIAAGDRYK